MGEMEKPLTVDELGQLTDGLEEFLATNHASACLDDDEDCRAVAEGVANWMVSDKVTVMSPEILLPKAKFHLCLNVVDEVSGEHIVRLTLDRTQEMEDGDFLQLQNFFWSTIGRAIRDNPEVIRTFQLGGVHVETDPLSDPGNQSYL